MSRRRILLPILLAGLLIVSSGCINRWNTRFPTCTPGPRDFDRRQAQVQDPFPDNQGGPATGFRPLEFQNQRPEAQRVKDQFYSGFSKSQNAVPAPPVQTLPPGASAPIYYAPVMQ